LLVAVQVTLGALTVLSGKQFIINSLHVVTGAGVLVTSLVLTLRAHRHAFSDAASPSYSPQFDLPMHPRRAGAKA
jgi:heme A synthase